MKYLICKDNTPNSNNGSRLELYQIYKFDGFYSKEDPSLIFLESSDVPWSVHRFVDVPETIIKSKLFTLIL